TKLPMWILRWSIAVVLGLSAAVLLVHHDHAGVVPAVAIALAAVELGFAALFAIPKTTTVGGVGLLRVLVPAAIRPRPVGQTPPIAFVVYAAAIWTVLRARRQR